MDKLTFKALRALNNMTQQEVADLVGVHRMTYASWESYKTLPNAEQLLKLAEIFKCSLNTFYFPTNAS